MTYQATSSRNPGAAAHVTLWILQILLAALFLFAGGVKLAMSPEALTAGSALPASFLYFIGLAEVAGGFGLILPGLLRIRRELTPLAAACLTIIMVGAVATTVGASPAAAAVPLATGLALVVVARGRRQWAVSIR